MTTRKQTKTKVENITRIEKLVGKTYNTLRRWKQDLNFPMTKEGGQWVAYKEDIKEWQACQAKGEEYLTKTTKRTKSSTPSQKS